MLFLFLLNIGKAQVITTFLEYPKPGTSTTDTVYYSSARKLKWSDFTGKIRSQSNFGALSFTAFSYEAAVREFKDTVWIKIYLQTYFVKPASWVRAESKNNYALSHEQLHFDLTRLMTKEFQDSVSNRSLSRDHYDIEIHFIYWYFWRKMTRIQEEFDKQTQHGKNKTMEREWEIKIEKALKLKKPE